MNINEKIEKARKRLEIADKYNNRDTNGEMFYVTAKISTPYVDIADIIEKIAKNNSLKDYLKEVCTDDWQYNVYNNYLSDQADYAREYMDGVAFNKDEPEAKQFELIKNSEHHYKRNDKLKRNCGFYGRSGGQFCFGSVSYTENLMQEADDALRYSEDTQAGESTTDDHKNAEREALDYLDQFNEYMDAIDETSLALERMRKGIEQDYTSELTQRVDELKDSFLDDSEERREYLNK